MFRSLIELLQAKTLKSCPATIVPVHYCPPRGLHVSQHYTHCRRLRISTVDGSDPEASLAMTETDSTAAADNRSSHGPESLRALSSELHNKVHAFLQEDVKTERLKKVQAQTKISLQVIEDALHQYSLSSLSLSYNGGKDCLVLLVLYIASLHTLSNLPTSLPSIYIPYLHSFPSVDDFVASSSKYYHLSLSRIAHPSMCEAFATYILENPEVKAIFVGTRRTDPHGANLTHFDKTDRGWPAFMRIHPVIDWRYAEIWAFLRHLGIEYCELYDQGYTSLGGTKDTHPNPALKEEGQEGRFRPAYELEEDDAERLGRDWR